MIPRELLDQARIPGQTGEIQLYRHGRDFSLEVHGIELMRSREHGSEELLAELALSGLARADPSRVLIGGLGMGFTLARALELVGDAVRIEVVELVPEIVTWNRRWFGDLNGRPLDDPRVAALTGDVAHRIREADALYDAILLDVDNGPEALTSDTNDRLYDRPGLIAARTALRHGGVLAIWSAAPDDSFTSRLERAGFGVQEHRVRARRTRGARRTIWVATREET